MESEMPLNPNPLQSSTFFSSPIDTLIESLDDPEAEHITLHDIIEAYATLSTRIRICAKALLEVRSSQHPALESLQAHSQQLYKCLSRDVQRLPPVPGPRSTVRNGDIPPEYVQATTDVTNVCHYALQVAASVLSLPALISLFSREELAILFHVILVHVQCQNSPGRAKTLSIALLIMRTQKLPSDILLGEAKVIKDILRVAMSSENCNSTDSSDALLIICHLLRRHPQNFISVLSSFVAPTMSYLSSSSLEHRLQAANALCSFAAAKRQHSTVQLTDSIAESLRIYIERQFSESVAHNPARLPNMLSQIISDDKGKGSRWSLSVIASLIVLSDYHLFLHPKSLKLVLNALSQIRKSKSHCARAEHSLLWRCLIWAFSQIPKNESNPLEDTWRRAFNVVRQELGRGGGAALASVLSAGISSNTDLAQTAPAISLLLGIPSDVITNHGHSATSEGLALLSQIISGSAKAGMLQECQPLVCISLIDGSLLKSKPVDDMSTIVESLECSHLPDVRPLTQNELVYHLDEIVKIWKRSAEKCLEESNSVPDDVFKIWRTLLSLHSYIGHQSKSPKASFKSSIRVASIVAGFAAHYKSAKVDAASLGFIKNLWIELRNIFNSYSLSNHAELILAKVLEQDYNILNQRLRSKWSSLCSELVAEGIPTLLRTLHKKRQRKEELDVTRELWAIFGREFLYKRTPCGLDDSVSFLTIPFGVWTLTNLEIDIWRDAFSKSIGDTNVDFNKDKFIARLIESLSKEKLDRVSITAEIIITILTEVTTELPESLITHFFEIIGQVLQDLYGTPQKLSAAQSLIRLVGGLLSSWRPTTLARRLEYLQHGLCVWLKDENHILTDSDCNTLIQTIYCNSLATLLSLECSVELITVLLPFFTSVFNRVPPPGLGPMAFKNYWKTKCRENEEIARDCPREILVRLNACVDCCEQSQTESLSCDTGSQVLSVSSGSPQSQTSQTQRPEALSDLSDGENANNSQLVLSHGLDETYLPVLTPSTESAFAYGEKRKRNGPYDVIPSPKRRRTEPWLPVENNHRSHQLRRTRSEMGAQAVCEMHVPVAPGADWFVDSNVECPLHSNGRERESDPIVDFSLSSPPDDKKRGAVVSPDDSIEDIDSTQCFNISDTGVTG